MKKTPSLLLGICSIILSQTIHASAFSRPVSMNEENIQRRDPITPIYVSLDEFMQLTPKQYEKITGKKMTFFQKIAFRIKQHQLKRMLKNNAPEFLSDFEATGFVLGLFMSLVGIGISYLIDYKETRKWAWRGAAIGGVFILIALLL